MGLILCWYEKLLYVRSKVQICHNKAKLIMFKVSWSKSMNSLLSWPHISCVWVCLCVLETNEQMRPEYGDYRQTDQKKKNRLDYMILMNLSCLIKSNMLSHRRQTGCKSSFHRWARGNNCDINWPITWASSCLEKTNSQTGPSTFLKIKD